MSKSFEILQDRALSDPGSLIKDALNLVAAHRGDWVRLSNEKQRAIKNWDFHRSTNHHIHATRCSKCLRTSARVIAAFEPAPFKVVE